MGPLSGLRIIEMAGIGPGPFTAMLLADMGADIIRVDRRKTLFGADAGLDVLNRGRPSIVVDLKHPDGVDTVLRLVEAADGLIEGYRPGVMERLGLGPEACLARNPRLVYGRMTGWGQDGPMASAAGHDNNYIALAGVLRNFARSGHAPVPPLNLVGDFGGGGMFLAFGVVCGLLEASRSGQGQVVDAAMVDGSAVLMTMIYAFRAQGIWAGEPGDNLLDTGAPFYDVYETSDGEYVAIGAIEGQFYAELLDRLGIDAAELPHQMDRSQWPALKARFAEIFRTRTRAEWCELLEGSDACFAPVLSMDEAHRHPHNAARATFTERGGVLQPAPAPRFSRTAPELGRPPSSPGADTDEALAAWGFADDEIAKLRDAGAVG
jgi:alpha-methylacyl-CoA racemase